jgi:hypothetical protein
MTIKEKIPTLNTAAPGIASLGLNGYNWWEEASTGVSNNHQTTKFAYPITTGKAHAHFPAIEGHHFALQRLAVK